MKVVNAFEQECAFCRTVFRFRYLETYRIRDRLGELKDGRFVQCSSCKQGQRAEVP